MSGVFERGPGGREGLELFDQLRIPLGIGETGCATSATTFQGCEIRACSPWITTSCCSPWWTTELVSS